MRDTVKSIFRQREIEKIYKLEVNEHHQYGMCSFHTTRSIVGIGNEEVVISDKEIGRYDIEIPMLEIGDEFFLHDIQEIIVIKNKMRSSDGSVTYYAEDKVVETANSKKSYEECKEEVKHWNYEKEKFERLKMEFEDYKKEYKYKNRFFNRKQS